MKRWIVWGTAVVVIFLAGITWAANTDQENAAIATAGQWLALLDTGKYADSWREANEYFRNSIKQDQWNKTVQSVRINLGKLKTRKLKAKLHKTPSPNEPKGRYLIIQYASSFQNKKSVTEGVVVMLDKNGRWQVSGYHLM